MPLSTVQLFLAATFVKKNKIGKKRKKERYKNTLLISAFEIWNDQNHSSQQDEIGNELH